MLLVRRRSRPAPDLGRPSVLAAIAFATALAAISGCGGAGEPAGEGRAQSGAVAAAGSVVSARTKQFRRAERAILLRMPRVGRLTARCSAEGAASVVFTAGRLLPTSAVTVASAGRTVVRRLVHPEHRVAIPAAGPSDFQTWQVEPFAKAGVRVTTISVAMGRSPGAPAYDCGFSAHATTTSEPAQSE